MLVGVAMVGLALRGRPPRPYSVSAAAADAPEAGFKP
jgi:hypothetical protein